MWKHLYAITKWGLIQGCKAASTTHTEKLIITDLADHHVNRLKKKKSHDHTKVEKTFDKNSYPFMILKLLKI